MSITFASLSHSVNSALKSMATASTTPELPLGHVHQALSAALGFNSHAALKAAVQSGEESTAYDNADHVLIDLPRLSRRMSELGHPTQMSAVEQAIRSALDAMLPNAKLHASVSDLGEKIHRETVGFIENDDRYCSEVALTNTCGGQLYLSFKEAVPIDEARRQWIMNASGSCSLDQDPDRVFCGSEINVSARVVFQKLGRRVLCAMDVEVTSANLQGDEPEPEDEPENFEPPTHDTAAGARNV